MNPAIEVLADAVRRFQENEKKYDPAKIRAQAEKFSKEKFVENIREYRKNNQRVLTFAMQEIWYESREINLEDRKKMKNLNSCEIMIDPKIKIYLDRLAESQSRPGSYIFVGAGEAGKEEAVFYFISKLPGNLARGIFQPK